MDDAETSPISRKNRLDDHDRRVDTRGTGAVPAAGALMPGRAVSAEERMEQVRHADDPALWTGTDDYRPVVDAWRYVVGLQRMFRSPLGGRVEWRDVPSLKRET